MPKVKISEFDTVAANNTDIDGINLGEGMLPSDVNNAIRELMSQLKDFQAGTAGDPFNGAVNGTVGATTPAAGNFTTVDATNIEVTNLKAKDGTAAGSIADSTGVVTLASSVLTTTDINGGTIDGAVIGGSTAAAGTFTSLSDSGNLTFTGTGNRIRGDFSNATAANRVSFQTSTTDNNTAINVLTNGTGTVSQMLLYAGSDAANASFLQLFTNTSEGRVNASRSGTGSFLPLTMYTGGSERLRIDTSGRVGIGTSSPSYLLDANVDVVRFGNTSAGFIQLGSSSTATQNYHIGSVASGSYFAIFQGNYGSGTERMRITSSGLVGIGEAAPTSKLEVAGSGANNAGSRATFEGTIKINEAGSSTLAATGGLEFKGSVFGAGYGSKIFSTDAGDLLFGNRNNSATWSERMRIDTSGNVLVGTTLAIGRLATVTPNSGYGFAIRGRDSDGQSIMSSMDRSGTVYTGNLTFPEDGSILFGRLNTGSQTERMRIDSSGNVGIGTSSPSYKLDVVGNANSPITSASQNSNSGVSATARFLAISDGGNAQIAACSTNYTDVTGAADSMLLNANSMSNGMVFGIDGVIRMKLGSSGELLTGGTTDNGAYNLQCNGTGVWGAGAYVNGSDARIKEDVAPIDSGLDVVAKLNPVTYRYKETWTKDQSTQTGFIAQELLVALEGKNYVDGVVQQGGEYMSVAYQNIIPILTKAIQELKAELDSVKAELQTLKGN